VTRVRASLLLVPLVVGLTLTWRAEPALAACAPPSLARFSRAQSVVVGTVTNVKHDGYWAEVALTEIWRGRPLARHIEIRSGASAMENDVTFHDWQIGRRYLISYVDHGPDPSSTQYGGRYESGGCGQIVPWTAQLSALRPANALAATTLPVEAPSGAFSVGHASVAEPPSASLLWAIGIGILATVTTIAFALRWLVHQLRIRTS
jgi:hypothetical protein